MIRHFETAGNREKRYIGTTDEPVLSLKTGKAYPEAEALFVSPLLRCRQTAEGIYPGMRQTLWEGFRECDFGAFEGKNYQELSGNADYQAWIDSGGEHAFPGGEARKEFQERTAEAFEKSVELLIKNGVEKAALVVHGGTIMAVLDAFDESGKPYFSWQCANGCGYLIHISEEEWKNGKKKCKVERKL